MAVIDLLRQYNAAHGLGCGPDDPIIKREDGSVWHTNSLYRRQSSVCKEAGLLHRSFHKIRKTWISELLTFKTLPVTTVRDLAGHSDARMTLNVYGKSVVPDSGVRESHRRHGRLSGHVGANASLARLLPELRSSLLVRFPYHI